LVLVAAAETPTALARQEKTSVNFRCSSVAFHPTGVLDVFNPAGTEKRPQPSVIGDFAPRPTTTGATVAAPEHCLTLLHGVLDPIRGIHGNVPHRSPGRPHDVAVATMAFPSPMSLLITPMWTSGMPPGASAIARSSLESWQPGQPAWVHRRRVVDHEQDIDRLLRLAGTEKSVAIPTPEHHGFRGAGRAPSAPPPASAVGRHQRRFRRLRDDVHAPTARQAECGKER